MAPPKLLSVALCTARRQPQFQWAADSFARALEHSLFPVELLVVDMMLWGDTADRRRAELAQAVAGRFPYTHVPPKPSPWQGPWRKTLGDYFAISSARNTALALARGEYVCYFDDCIALDEKYLLHMSHAAARGLALAGTFKGWNTAKVVDGRVIEGALHDAGNDNRGTNLISAPGGWFYALCCGAPLDAFLAINGFDERFDGAGGGEDCSAGVCIQRAGYKVVYDPGCLVHQILETHRPCCEDDSTGQTVYRKQKELILKADGKPHYANEILVEALAEDQQRARSLGNEFELRELRAKVLREGYGAFPTTFALDTDWRDGQKLSEMA